MTLATAAQHNIIAPPTQKGMLTLNRNLFRKMLNLKALSVNQLDAKLALKMLGVENILSLPRLKTVVMDPESNLNRMVLLDHGIQGDRIEELPNKVYEFAKEKNAILKNYEIELDYSYWTYDQIMSAIFPQEVEVPSSFEAIGHIAHLNLRDEYLPYKHLIGEIIIDKSNHIKTVVNKVGTIENTFRFFKMEVLAGQDTLITQLKESDCIFHLDFSKLYWNSRLQGEHDRLVKLLKKNEIVCDVFAGIGPFALPGAKNQGAIVFANDLNPASHEYLIKNVTANKMNGKIRPYNMDGRDFIKQSLVDLNSTDVIEDMKGLAMKELIRRKNSKSSFKEFSMILPDFYENPLSSHRVFDHYIMNLPATAIEFLDAFKGIYKGLPLSTKLPMIHCYCFSRSQDEEGDIVERVESVLGSSIRNDYYSIKDIRDVAPKKRMFCISFKLPRSVAFE